ncbi:MAG: hypothetical protein MJE77_14425 [Proteobacteria bacterium]|nr:hypothetical protein [Pseudomonadota bacterium]
MKQAVALWFPFAVLGLSTAFSGLAEAQSLDETLAEIDEALEDIEDAVGETTAVTVAKSNYSCSKHQNLLIDGKKFAASQKTNKIGGKKAALVIDASGHCNVVLRNLDIAGVIAINASGHANILIKDSTVWGGNAAIVASGHANVAIRNSTVTSKKLSIKASGHANVHADKKSRVQGRVTTGRYANYVKQK